MSADRLNDREIVLMRALMQRGASMRPILLAKWQRERAVPLWRRGLIEIWWRASPTERPALPGPFFGLTIVGARIASSFLPAPRGISGAEQSS